MEYRQGKEVYTDDGVCEVDVEGCGLWGYEGGVLGS
jgi:hypothetical protein